MTVALPLPYEDELLYSVICRYMNEAAVEAPTSVLRILFGRIVHPSRDLLFDLGQFAEQTQIPWGLSAFQIAQRYTLLPYYTSYATQARRAAVYEVINGMKGGQLRTLLGLQATHVQNPSTFRFCKQCAKDDMARVGEAYWKRSHQLPGVFACLVHGIALQISSLPQSSKSMKLWLPGHDVIATTASTCSDIANSWANNADLLEVMRKSTELIFDASPHLLPHMRDYYYKRAQDVGLVESNGYIQMKTIRAKMIGMYGQEYLDAIGLSLSPSPKEAWPLRMMKREQLSYQPLQHILLRYFFDRFEQTTGAADPAIDGRRITCPNRYAPHGPNHFVDRMKVQELPDGNPVSYGYCSSCGLRFAFTRCRPGTSMPEVSRIFALGRGSREAAKLLKKGGMSRSAIAHRMDMSLTTVKTMLKSPIPGRIRVFKGCKADVRRWRQQWQELVTSVVPGGHKMAKKCNEHLYYLLNTYDRDWLRKSAKRSARLRALSTGQGVNWVLRDKQWSVELRKAAARILAAGPKPIRASRTAIAVEAGLHVMHPLAVTRLPRCQATLKELEESVEQFQLRRMEKVARSLASDGKSVSRSILLHDSGIPPSMVTPNLAAAIERLEKLAL
jgi:hypothetical protein